MTDRPGHRHFLNAGLQGPVARPRDWAVASCRLCPWQEEWTTTPAAQAASVWHVVEQHPLDWLRIAGERPPQDPRPEMLGSTINPKE